MNFKCSIENDKKTVIIKEIDPLMTMKQFELVIAEKMELKSSFQILTGYPPAILLYEATDPINTKLKGNDLLIISIPMTDLPQKNKHNTKIKKPSLNKEKKNKAKSSTPNISYFSDQISNSANQIGKDRESKGADEDFELDDSDDDGVIGIL